MYYLDEIMDRSVDSWSTMLGDNEYSFWATSEIEMKPNPETQSTPESPDTNTAISVPEEIPAWEPADTNVWDETTEEACESNPISETLQNIAGTARQVLEEINPFTDREPDDD